MRGCSFTFPDKENHCEINTSAFILITKTWRALPHVMLAFSHVSYHRIDVWKVIHVEQTAECVISAAAWK